MFVITADQVNSRSQPDAVAGIIDELAERYGAMLTLPPDRSAGDEVQLITEDAATALDAILGLTRTGQWSVGLGVGTVRIPLGKSIRETTGAAFIAARTAVDRAKGKTTRFAVETVAESSAGDAEAVIDLLLLLRGRRSAAGWELYDLLADGLSQAAAAQRLGISPQAASARARSADLRAEFAVTGALTRLVHTLAEEVA